MLHHPVGVQVLGDPQFALQNRRSNKGSLQKLQSMIHTSAAENVHVA
jgi:hypothetical protein